MVSGKCVWVLGALLSILGCQDYFFETREPKQVNGVRIDEALVAVRPTDVLFLIDNSLSMNEEIGKVRASIERFVDELSSSDNDYQIGLITPDVECNIPGVFFTAGGASVTCESFSRQPCSDDVSIQGGKTDCDGGRLRSKTGFNRVFRRPTEANKAAWLTDVQDTLSMLLGEKGTSYEAGLEAIRRAVVCSIDEAQRMAAGLTCPDKNVATLNAGFIRPEATLVIIIVSDEDDCSFIDDTAYLRPTGGSPLADQTAKLLTPLACYAYHGTHIDSAPQDGVMDWVTYFGYRTTLNSVSTQRTVDPPLPTDVSVFVNDIIAAKGGDPTRVRVAAIVGGVSSAPGPLADFTRGSCRLNQVDRKPTNQCACFGIDPCTNPKQKFQCAVVTETSTATGLTCNPASNCEAMTGGRYLDFVQALGDRYPAGTGSVAAVVDSVCQDDYLDAMVAIAGLARPDNCLGLGIADISPASIEIIYNGKKLTHVQQGSHAVGWSQVPGSEEICIEGPGDTTLKITDEFKILWLSDNQ